MALTLFSLLLLRNLSCRSASLTRKTRSFWSSHCVNFKPFSTSESSLLQTNEDHPKLSDPKSSLSARMSFVFDQIDAIDKEKGSKDEALQRIRAWREIKKKKNEEEHAGLGFGRNFDSSSRSDAEVVVVEKKKENLFTKGVELVHPWPEWIELMERLVQQNYFDNRRKDEDGMPKDLPVEISEFSEEGFDFTRDWNTVRTACLNFGRDRFDILRSLSRKDIQILVGHGCPSVDKKVVFSAKLLRKHAHLDEGDVCSSCSLRSSCERGYLLTPKEDEARTFDIMRILLTFGFDPVNGSVENKSLLKIKSLRTVVRKLLHEVVKLSAVPIDPNLPPPVIKKPPPKVKQPPPPPRKRVGRDDIEMKKGDWLCPKCDFMNFAKNTVCLQCDAKRPKRQLLPGEWECPECNFLNYRRNMACFHCEHKRPPDEFMENQVQGLPHGRRRGLERVNGRPEVSNAWNFDFDDDESDGADVAAFEFADPPTTGEDFDGSVDSRVRGGNLRPYEDDSPETSRIPMAQERGRYSDHDQIKSGTGFNDFDDEEDDDIDSYELDTPRSTPKHEVSSKNFSEFEGFESEDFDDTGHHSPTRQGTDSTPDHKPSRPKRGKAAFSGSEDDEFDLGSDEELPVHPNWKSSHIADSRQRTSGKGRSGPYRNISYGSDDELGIGSRSGNDLNEDFGSKRSMGNKWSSNRRGLRKAESSDSEDSLQFGSESDDNDIRSHRNKVRGNKMGPGIRGNMSKGHDQFKSVRDSRVRFNSMRDGRDNSFGNADLDRSPRGSHGINRGFRGDRRGDPRDNSFGNADLDRLPRGSHGTNRGFRGDHRGGPRVNDRGGNLQNFSRPGWDGRDNSFGNVDLDRSPRGSHGIDKGFRGGRRGDPRVNDRGGNMQNFSRPGREEGSRNQQRRRFNKFDNQSDMMSKSNDDRPRRRIIER